MKAGPVTQLGYLVLGAVDIDAWESFATEVLGMAVSGRLPDGGLELRMDEHSYRLVVEASGTDDVDAIGWQVAGPDQLAQAERRLAEAGIEYERDADATKRRRVGDMIRLQDPAQVPLELYWGPETAVGMPFVPGRPITGFAAGVLGLGHVVLAVDDVAGCVRFYTDMLGFELSDHGNGPFTFLRCNPRHHSVAFGPAAAVRSDKRLLHFMVEMNDVDDVGTALDLCHARKIPIAITLGRHTNDRMLSFYAHTPSGFRFECGHGGLLVGDDWQVPRYQRREVWGHERVEETLLSPPGEEGASA